MVDAIVVALARDGDPILTSDVTDLTRLVAAAAVRATLLAT